MSSWVKVVPKKLLAKTVVVYKNLYNHLLRDFHFEAFPIFEQISDKAR